MRKFYSFGLLVLLSVFFGVIAVAQTVTVNNIVYYCNTYSGMAQVEDARAATGDVVISPEVEWEGKKYPVVYIYESAFRENTAITSVDLPASVNQMGRYAFYGCSNLLSVTGGAERFLIIGIAPFYGTPFFERIPIEYGLKYWKGWVMYAQSGIGYDELHIKEGTVGKLPFSGVITAKTVYLPKTFMFFNNDEMSVEKFVVDKEHRAWFSDDYGAIYEKDGRSSYYSTAEQDWDVVTGRTLYRVPVRCSGSTFRVAEGTVVLAERSCMNGNFERLIVPEGCEYVLPDNFDVLKRCKYIELPSTLKHFEMVSPSKDNNLEIVLKAKEVPETGDRSDPFNDCRHVTLYVPKESLEKYLADTRYGGKFKEIKAILDNVALKGDVNGDGKVNAADVTTVYNYIANPEPTGLTLDKVDINGDGNVNATDITDLYNIIQME